MTHEEWIAERLTREDCHNQCQEWTAEMMLVFPDIFTRVRGYVMVPGIGPRPHWWLTLADGTVVDPTLSQFFDVPGSTLTAGPKAGTKRMAYYSGAGAFGYEPVDETNPPIGRCCNCGDTCYKLTATCSIICSPECDADYRAYIMREEKRGAAV